MPTDISFHSSHDNSRAYPPHSYLSVTVSDHIYKHTNLDIGNSTDIAAMVLVKNSFHSEHSHDCFTNFIGIFIFN